MASTQLRMVRSRDSSAVVAAMARRSFATPAFVPHAPVTRRKPAASADGNPCIRTTAGSFRKTQRRTLAVAAPRTFAETKLGVNGTHLLDGLDIYSVPAADDGHPLAVYGIASETPQLLSDTAQPFRRPILLLHGRTWSSVPVYHLLGGPTYQAQGAQSRSFMEALLEEGLQPYAMDFRGFGGTHYDDKGFVEPLQCVKDMESVLQWIAERHRMSDSSQSPAELAGCGSLRKPALLGWSQGALVAHLGAQKPSSLIGKLILYGSIYDPLVRYPREPLYLTNKPNMTIVENTFDDAIEDFTIEGTIPPEPARLFAEAALVSDPIKARWRNTYQFNNCDPARVQVPTLVVAGDQDPYAPLHVQQELFCNLGRGCDRTWGILSGSDHAVHLLEGRARLTKHVSSFVQNGEHYVGSGY